MSQTRILVTGGSGFIARALIPILVEKADVTLLLRQEPDNSVLLSMAPDRSRSKCDIVYADLRNREAIARAVKQARPDRVIHLAAAGVSDPFLDVDSALSHNVTGTLNLLRACFESVGLDVKQLIVARTPGERTAMNVYAASKAAAWTFCRMYARTAQWPIQGAMIFQAYGPGQPSGLLVSAALQAALVGHDFPMTSGDQEKDWIYIDEVVDGLLALLDSALPPGETIEIGCGRSTSVRDIVSQIYQLVGRGGRPQIGALPDRPGEVIRQVADVERTAALIGWRAEITPAEGLGRLVNLYLDPQPKQQIIGR